MRAPIHSKKHIVQISQGTVGQALHFNAVLVDSEETPSTVPSVIEEGAIVKACYVELWLSQDSASTVGSYTVVLYKDPGSSNSLNAADGLALHDYSNKKNILFTAQGLLTPNDGGQVPVLRQWYKIPKGKQRFGLGDRLMLYMRNNNLTAIDQNHCGLAIYKEYT